jgi:hypothetical protein
LTEARPGDLVAQDHETRVTVRSRLGILFAALLSVASVWLARPLPEARPDLTASRDLAAARVVAVAELLAPARPPVRSALVAHASFAELDPTDDPDDGLRNSGLSEPGRFLATTGCPQRAGPAPARCSRFAHQATGPPAA